MICRVPAYPDKGIDRPVVCRIVAQCEGKLSDPLDFVYRPGGDCHVTMSLFITPLPFSIYCSLFSGVMPHISSVVVLSLALHHM